MAFAVSIDPSGGQLSVAQYLSIKHDDRGDPNETNDNGTNGNDAAPNDTPDPIQQTVANGAILATVTVTDGDGDTATSSVAVGGKVTFLDDGPTVNGTALVSATVDEDALTVQSDGNIDTGRPGETGSLTPSATATGLAGALLPLVNFGSDGPHPTSAFQLVTQTTPSDSGFNSKGGDVLIVSDGSTLTGYVDAGGGSATKPAPTARSSRSPSAATAPTSSR